MRSARRPYISQLLAVKGGALLAAVPIAAYAAQIALHRVVNPEDLGMWTWIFLLAFSNAAWAIQHLDAVVEWVADGDPKTAAEWRALWRIRIQQVITPWLAANAAGIMAYMLAKSAPAWFNLDADPPEMVLLIGAFFAALGGQKSLEKISRTFFSRQSAAPGSDGQQP